MSECEKCKELQAEIDKLKREQSTVKRSEYRPREYGESPEAAFLESGDNTY